MSDDDLKFLIAGSEAIVASSEARINSSKSKIVELNRKLATNQKTWYIEKSQNKNWQKPKNAKTPQI